MRYCVLHGAVCVWMILFIFSVTNAGDSTIQSCLNEPYSKFSMEEFDSVEIGDVIYYLYKINSSEGLTWCEAHQACRAAGQNLTVLNTMALQSQITGLNMTGVTGDVWISGRRKDYGADWTWINNTLNNYTGKFFMEEGRDCGRVLWSEELYYRSSDCTADRMSFCTIGSNDDCKRDWYAAQNECVKKGGRLPTAEEFIQRVDGLEITDENYWVGLSYRPWLWVSQNVSDNELVLYSSWSVVPYDGDCMALEPNGTWISRQCDQRLDHFICQAEKVDPNKAGSTVGAEKEDPNKAGSTVGAITATMDPFQSTNDDHKDTGSDRVTIIILAVVVSVFGVIIIIITSVLVLKMRHKQQPKNNNHIYANSGQESDNGRAEGAPDNPPDSRTYTPGAEYAEIAMLSSEATTVPAPGPANTVNTDPMDPLTGAHAPSYDMLNVAEVARATPNTDVYMDLETPRVDETTLYENAI